MGIAYFVDSSALVKRYVTEVGTGWMQEISDPSAGNEFIVARITWIEVLSALARRQREGNLPLADVTQARRSFCSEVISKAPLPLNAWRIRSRSEPRSRTANGSAPRCHDREDAL